MAKHDTTIAVPRLRFPEFRGGAEWDTERMDKLYSFMRNNALSRDRLNYEGGAAKNVHYGDIHTKFSSLFDITKEHVPYINETEALPGTDSSDYCIEGDLIFADASEDTNDVGKCIEVVHLDGQLLLAGQHTILARRRNDRVLVGFGGHLFRSPRVRAQVQKEAQGTKVYSISPTRLAGINISLPSDKREQQKIADCLTSLEGVIAAQGRKLEALQTYKRGLMQHLFPLEGETLPSLRLEAFRDAPDWREFLLSELEVKKWVELGRGEVISHKDMRANPGPYPVYSSSVVDDGLMGKYGRFLFDEELITWSVDGGGDFFFRPKHKFSVTNVSGYMRVLSDDIDCQFLAFQLQQLHASQTFDYQQKAHPSVIRTLYRIRLPEPNEQRQISGCLESLVAQVSAEVAKLDKLKAHKKGLMQQLFPSPVEVEV